MMEDRLAKQPFGVEDYIGFAESLKERCRRLEKVHGIGKLERKIHAEVKFLNSLKKQDCAVSSSHLSSSNMCHFASIVHAAEELPGVTSVLQPFRSPARGQGSLVVDVVAGQGHHWVKVIARKGQALHLVWAGQGQFGERDLVAQAKDYVHASINNLHHFTPPLVHMVFYNQVTIPMAEALTSLGICVWGQRVRVNDDVMLKLTSVLTLDDTMDEEDDDDCVDILTNDRDSNSKHFDTDDVNESGLWNNNNDESVMAASDSKDNQIQSFHHKLHSVDEWSDESVHNSKQDVLYVCNSQSSSSSYGLNTSAMTTACLSEKYYSDSQISPHHYDSISTPANSRDNKQSTDLQHHKSHLEHLTKDSQPSHYRSTLSAVSHSQPFSTDLTSKNIQIEQSSTHSQASPQNNNYTILTSSTPCPNPQASKDSITVHKMSNEDRLSNDYHRVPPHPYDSLFRHIVISPPDFLNFPTVFGTAIGPSSSSTSPAAADSNYHPSDHHNSVPSKVNLDITSLITLVSNVTHGHCHFVFKEKVLASQAEEERHTPCLPALEQYLEGKEMYACQTAVSSFQSILDVLGGRQEKERAAHLLSRVTVVPDQLSTRAHELETQGKIKQRSKVVFGTGDSLKAMTVTSNSGFVRAARHQGIEFSVFLHPARALTEEKEATARVL